MWLFRILSSTIFLTSIVLSIPLAFDVGGRTCGLAYSLSVASFYFFVSVLRLSTPKHSYFRYSIVVLIRSTQFLIIPSLLIWCLNRFSLDSTNSKDWVDSTFIGDRSQETSIYSWIFGQRGLLETVTIGNWDKLLHWSTPFFQVVEGFCSLLVIQAAGQITRWLVNRGERGDTWMVSDFLIVGFFLKSTQRLSVRSYTNSTS